MRELIADVVIIGDGGAGMRAAICAKEVHPELDVMIVSKGRFCKCSTTALAWSDRMAFHATLPYTPPEKENWKFHAMDIYKIGGEVSDYKLAEILAKESAEALEYLVNLGVPFARNKEGKIDQFLTDGSIYPRACYVGPNTAIEIAKALEKRIRTMDIKILENTMVYDFLTMNNRVYAALAVDVLKNEQVLIRGKSFVLATGGAGELYRQNVFPAGMTGDGYAAALRAGAELVNMEFMQIGVCHTKLLFATSGSMFRSLPKIIDENGDEFLTQYISPITPDDLTILEFKKGAHWPISYESPTKIIDLAIYAHTLKGHKVFMDFRENPSYFSIDRIPEEILAWSEKVGKELFYNTKPYERLVKINQQLVDWLNSFHIDPAKEPVQVQNAVQHFQGGVKIDENAKTSVKGLYAAGECAGGQHGANRPGGNSLLDTQVFGKIAGKNAADEASVLTFERIKFEIPKIPSGQIPAKEVRNKLRDLISSSAFLVRMESQVSNALREIDALKEKGICVDENGLAYFYETRNMLLLAEAILTAILVRDESRGPHLRFKQFDPPKIEFLPRREEWNKYIVLKLMNRRIQTEVREPLRPKGD